MILNERIRILRKTLGLTVEKFGARVGVAKTTISRLENGVNSVTEQMFKSICREFNVNEDWLRDGVGEMFVEADTFSLDDFARSRGATAQELEILKAYFEIDADTRNNLIEHFINHLMAHSNSSGDGHPDTPEELERLYPPIEDTEMGVS